MVMLPRPQKKSANQKHLIRHVRQVSQCGLRPKSSMSPCVCVLRFSSACIVDL